MNRLNILFEKKRENVLSVYFTPGYPKLNLTRTIISELCSAGADIIEVGIPYSDPLADGPTIQASGDIALKNGMTLALLFEQLEGIRKETDIPLVMMGYLNPILQYGVENFCKKCKEIGIDGLIAPDLPLEVYQEEYKEIFDRYDIKNIFFITPTTSDERMRLIDSLSDSFIYMVSTAGITGARDSFKNAQIDYFKRVKSLNLRNPYLIGFGISNNKSFVEACNYSNGAIIGSAFVKLLADSTEYGKSIRQFVEDIRG
jgi:tryptophan synthase alpha chain